MRTVRGHWRTALVLSLPLVWAPACADATGDPLAAVITDETRAAVAVGLDLPSLPALLDEAVAAARTVPVGTRGTGASVRVARRTSARAPHADSLRPGGSSADPLVASLRGEAERWDSTWVMEPVGGRDARSRIYDRTVGPVARAIGEARVRTELERVQRVVRAVEDADLGRLPPEYRARVDDARRVAAWGIGALDRDDPAEALRAALEAADRLRAVSPRHVARTLLERARRGLARVDEAGEASGLERERIERLVRGAGTALEREQYPLAIRRAYYACRLLGLPVS